MALFTPRITWHEYSIVIRSVFYALLPVVAVVFGGQSSRTTTMLNIYIRSNVKYEAQSGYIM